MSKFFASLVVASCLCGGCTTNVENPTVNQQGRGGDTCITSCDDANITCVAKCVDDVCRASCETTHGNCVTSCAPGDGG